jgi:putative FmdB family regulatory protein
MPIHEFKCRECGRVWEILFMPGSIGFYNELQFCRECGGVGLRILSASNFHLKGPGFYVNDYPKQGKKEKKEGD